MGAKDERQRKTKKIKASKIRTNRSRETETDEKTRRIEKNIDKRETRKNGHRTKNNEEDGKMIQKKEKEGGIQEKKKKKQQKGKERAKPRKRDNKV